MEKTCQRCGNSFDCRNDDGKKVKDGVYFYLLYTEPGGKPNKGITLLMRD